jgi:thiol-disulfide isomerase/thioredoxin
MWMVSCRSLIGALLTLAFFCVGPANAVEPQPYEAAEVQKIIKTGKPVIVHVYAPWCLQCRAQAAIISDLPPEARLNNVKFFRVSYDQQKDVVSSLNCPRSTVIAYKNGKEVGRMSWGTSKDDVMSVLNAAL